MVALSTMSACLSALTTTAKADASVGPSAIARLSNALRLRRFRTLSVGLTKSEVGRRDVSNDRDDACDTRLSTLRRALGFENVLGLSVVGDLADSGPLDTKAAFNTCGGTAAFARVVISASLGVVRRKSPAT